MCGGVRVQSHAPYAEALVKLLWFIQKVLQKCGDTATTIRENKNKNKNIDSQ